MSNLKAPSSTVENAAQMDVKFRQNKANVAWSLQAIGLLKYACCGNSLKFELTAPGALKSLVTYCAPRRAGGKSEAVNAVLREGLKWACYNQEHKVDGVSLDSMKTKIESFVVSVDPSWIPTAENYGKISQYVFQLCNFSNAMRVLQNGETKKQEGNRTLKIGDYGFDVNRHAQLAAGFNLKPIEISKNKTAVGFATAAIYHIKADPDYKEQWQKVISFHFKGLGLPDSLYMDAISQNTTRSRDILSRLADLLLLIGDRRKHQFGVPLSFFFDFFTKLASKAEKPTEFMEIDQPAQKVQKTGDEQVIATNITRETVFDFSFTKAWTLKKISNHSLTVPTAEATKAKFLCLMAVLNNPYDDLGVLGLMVGRTFTRKEMGNKEDGVFKEIKKTPIESNALSTITLKFGVISSARKGHLYADLNMQNGQQVSSEPGMKGKRKREVQLAIESKKRRMGVTNDGDIGAAIEKVYERAADAILKLSSTGKESDIETGWYTAAGVPTTTIPVETGKFYFNRT